MKFVTYLIAFIAIYSVASVHGDDKTDQVNTFIDQILQSVLKMRPLDPLKLPNHNQTIDRKIGVIPLHIELHMQNIEIYGLGHIHRNGNASLNSTGGQFDLKFRLNDDHVIARSDLDINFNNHSYPNLKAEIDIGDIDVKLEIAVLSGKFDIKSFEIDELKNCKVYVHGLKGLDLLIDAAADVYLNLFNKSARKQITKLLWPIIKSIIHL